MRVACLGDSITFGQHLAERDAWPSVLAGLSGWETIGRGVCGDTTRLALERLHRDALSLAPDVLVVQFGLNDCNRWDTDHGLPRVSVEAFEANLAEIVAKARAAQVQTVCLVTLTPSTRQSLDRPHRYSAAVRKVAYRRALLFDAAEAIRHEHLLDGVHLNQAGHAAFAKGVQETLWAGQRSSIRPRSSIPTSV